MIEILFSEDWGSKTYCCNEDSCNSSFISQCSLVFTTLLPVMVTLLRWNWEHEISDCIVSNTKRWAHTHIPEWYSKSFSSLPHNSTLFIHAITYTMPTRFDPASGNLLIERSDKLLQPSKGCTCEAISFLSRFIVSEMLNISTQRSCEIYLFPYLGRNIMRPRSILAFYVYI